MSHYARMQIEHLELQNKCRALLAFIESNPIFETLAKEDQDLMTEQYFHMKMYSRCLLWRMGRMEK